MLQRVLWKLMPKAQRTFLLGRLSVVDRNTVNKAMTANVHYPEAFEQLGGLFVHVPKCAGSSVCKALFENWRPGHLPLYWYEQQFPQVYAEAFKFTFVRDPLERAYSAYTYLRGNVPKQRDMGAYQLVSRYPSFDDFVRGWLHAENVRRQLHFAPQTDFLVDAGGSLALDFIGRQETLRHDFFTLCELLKISRDLPHLNASKRPEGRALEFSNARTRQLVRQVYARDYELLGYE
ncbi:MAG: sulfotransferase family 2 domain-containing protein [Pseudomonas sp.]